MSPLSTLESSFEALNVMKFDGCRVLFDSFEVPGKEIPSSNQHDISETIDLSFAGEYLEHANKR